MNNNSGSSQMDTCIYNKINSLIAGPDAMRDGAGQAKSCLFSVGRFTRGLALVERKAILRGLVPRQPSRLLCVDHIVGHGVGLFRAVCEQDLEGIVAKQMDEVYDPDAPTSVKIKNRNYTQAVDRHERFEKMRAGV